MLDLGVESWVWYALVALVVILRFTSRILQTKSLRGLGLEDYIMLFVFVIFTILVSFMNIVATKETNLMRPGTLETLSPSDIADRVYGSKLVLVVEQSMIAVQWGCKVCLLMLYDKLTMRSKAHFFVKAVGVYVILSWLLMEILYFGVWCRPFSGYWEVPTPDVQCSTALNHLIVNAVFNISSDIMMLCIPLPILLASQLPIAKKMALCALFSLGIFVILCGTLNKTYSFRDPFSAEWTFWYIREAATAILVANIPNCWPLLRRIFHLRSFIAGNTSETNQKGTEEGTAAMRSKSFKAAGAVRVGSRSDGEKWDRKGNLESSSMEMINVAPVPMEIWENTTVVVRSEEGRFSDEMIANGNGMRGGETKVVISSGN